MSHTQVYSLQESPIQMDDEAFNIIWAMKPQQCVVGIDDVPYMVYGLGVNAVPEELEEYLPFGNSIMVNWYENGDKYIGYHSDTQDGLSGCIYEFSYGATRCFTFMDKATKQVDAIMLQNNSLIIMKENTQNTHTHALPVMKNVGKRISITVRTINYL